MQADACTTAGIAPPSRIVEPDTTPTTTLIETLPDGRERRFYLKKDAIHLGRAPVNDVMIEDGKASRNHAVIRREGGQFTVEDLGSTNGTFLGEEKLEGSAPLAAGQAIRIGQSTYRLEGAEPELDWRETQISLEKNLEETLIGQDMPSVINDVSVSRIALMLPGHTQEFPLLGDVVKIGRGEDNDIVLPDPQASVEHAVLERVGETFRIRDLGSRNGVFLGAQKIEQRTLHNGQAFRIGGAILIFKRGFQPDEISQLQAPGGLERKPVVIVPGLMGSELWLGEDRIWPNVWRMYREPDSLEYAEDSAVEARALVSEVVIVPNFLKQDQYNRLTGYFISELGYELGKNLFEFPYDWRQDCRKSAQQLAARIESWDIDGPVTIVAHSMGTLVSRYYIEHLGGNSKVERLIGMGAPHQGSPKAFTSLILPASLLPLGVNGERLRDLFRGFPSAYQVLPTHPCIFDRDGTAMEPLKDDTLFPHECHGHLRAAHDFRTDLDRPTSVPTVSIFGYGVKSLSKVIVDRDSAGQVQEMEVRTEFDGDDTVPETSAIVKGSEIHPVNQHHGSLYTDNDVRMRLKMELTKLTGG